MAENELPESARRADSTPVFASERDEQVASLMAALKGENRAPCPVCNDTGGYHVAGCSALAGDLPIGLREPNEPAPHGPRRCGAFIGSRGACALVPNHSGNHEPAREEAKP